jgi:hypothetical protein
MATTLSLTCFQFAACKTIKHSTINKESKTMKSTHQTILAAALAFALAFTTSCGEHSWENNLGNSFVAGGEEADDNPLLWQTVRMDNSIRSSADYVGNQYLSRVSMRPSVSTFVNEDGTVTVCVSDDNAKVAHIYEFSMNLELQNKLSFPYELDMLGAFTKDSEGNYYFFFAQETANVYKGDAANEPENMATVKYNKNGNKIKAYKINPRPLGSYSGIQEPFRSGTCRLEVSGSMLAVHFARRMFMNEDDGIRHQASYYIELNKDTFEPGYTGFPFVSHSFDQFILPIDNGFVFSDHGDAFPQRAFNFMKYVRIQGNPKISKLSAFRFLGESGDNTTNAQMGGLAKTSGGYIFSGTYSEVPNKRNLFTLTLNEAFTNISNPAYITNYADEEGNVGSPKIVGIGSGQYLLLWELLRTSGQSHYLSTKAQIVNESGSPLSPVKDLGLVRLSMNDVLRYNPRNGRVYWAINDPLGTSIVVYALDAQYAYANTNANFDLPFRVSDGHGLTLRRFNPDKTTVSQNEVFKVDFTLSDVSSTSFPGALAGVALTDDGYNIVEIVGTLDMAPVADLNRSNKKINCKIPDTVPSGQYKLRIVVKAIGKDEWKIVMFPDGNIQTILDFTVR